MKTLIFSTLLLTTSLQAQQPVQEIPAKDREATDAQSLQVLKVLQAVNFAAEKVVYPIWAERERIAYGISIGESRLLAKASEVLAEPSIFTVNRDKVSLFAKVIGIYPEHDLAIIEVPGLKSEAVQWSEADSLDEGAFLAAIKPNGETDSMGVLSVKERSLKSEDQGFLGIQMDTRESGDGVRVQEVVRESAAEEVGIRVGDFITMINGEEVKGFFELSTRLRRLKNGEQPEIEFMRGQNVIKVKPTLKGRMVQEQGSRRLERMDRMSGSQSRVRGEFSNVIQSDMALESSDAGLPVVDLEGRIVGMVIARAGRISTLILPSDDIEEVLRGEATPYVPSPKNVRRGRRLREESRRNQNGRDLDALRRLFEGLRGGSDRD